MTCICCSVEIPLSASVLLCPPCAQALVLYPPIVKCGLHKRVVDTRNTVVT